MAVFETIAILLLNATVICIARRLVCFYRYAAPNTPIASSKRPKAPKADIKSPGKLVASRVAVIAPPKKVAGGGADTAPAVTGVLFSPQLTKGSEDELNDEEEVYEAAEEEEVEDEEEAFNPYLFIAGLPPHNTVVIRDKICLPPIKGVQTRPTLALDLDETLVHCTVEPIAKPDLTFPVTFNGTFYQVYVRKRPYLDYFLETVSKSFEVVVFTASQKVYADVLLDLLDPEKKLIQHRLFRESCLFVQGNYLKDLTVLGRDMTKVGGAVDLDRFCLLPSTFYLVPSTLFVVVSFLTQWLSGSLHCSLHSPNLLFLPQSPHKPPSASFIDSSPPLPLSPSPLLLSSPPHSLSSSQSVLVDNSPHAYGYDLDNGIPIESWFDDESDTELLKLIGFLRNIVDASDVRPIVREHFKSYQLVKNATLGHPPVTSAPPF